MTGLSLQRTLLLLALLLIAMSQHAFASLDEVDETISWEEDVVLHSGQVLSVKRTVTITRFRWERPKSGRLTKRSIAFTHGGKRVEWINDDRWPISYMPDVLEIVEDEPVVFMPVYRWGPCKKYGFPQEGVVAFRLRNGNWSLVPAQEFRQDLKVNLFRSIHALQYSPELKNGRLMPEHKRRLDSSGVPKQGTSLRNAGKFYTDNVESCAWIRPPHNAELERLRQRNGDAERDAITIRAKIVSMDNDSRIVTKEMYAAVVGKWSRAGFLSEQCNGVVTGIEPLEHWKDDGSMHLVGYTLLLAAAGENKKKVQIPGASTLQRVTCDPTTIFVVKRKDKETLIIHRFNHAGDLIDAFRVALLDTVQIVAGTDWGTVWTVIADAAGILAISIGDYSNPHQPSLGGTIKRTATYAVPLPSK